MTVAAIPMRRTRKMEREELAVAAKRLRNLPGIEIVPAARPSGRHQLPPQVGAISIETATRFLAVHMAGAKPRRALK